MTTATATAPGQQSFRDVWLISLAHGLTHWYLATFFLLLPVIGREFGLSYTQIGIIMTVQYVMGALTNLPAGMLVDTMGKKGYWMALSLFWIGFPYALISLTHSFWMVLICMTLVGMGNNFWHPAAISALAQRYPDRKGLVLSIHGMGGNVGEALAPFVIGAMLAWFSWRTVVVLNVAPGLIMSVVILLVLGAFTMDRHEEKTKKHAGGFKSYMKGFSQLLTNKPQMLLAVSSAFRNMTQAGLRTFLPVYLAYELGYSTFIVGVILAVLQLMGFISQPIAGHLSDKMGRKRVVASSMALTAVMIVGIVLAGKSLIFILFVSLIGFFLFATRAVVQAWAIEAAPRNLAGSAIGLQFGVGALGSSFGPALFGIVADHYGIYPAFYFLAGTIVFANVLIVFMPSGALEHREVAASA